MYKEVNNELVFLSETSYLKYQKTINEANNLNSYIINIDGNSIQSVECFLDVMEKKFHFPWKCEGIFDRYEDFMTDLSWLDKHSDKIILTIMHYNQLLKNDLQSKYMITESFYDSILPFWEREVDWIAAPGKRKEFKVFCVNDDKNRDE